MRIPGPWRLLAALVFLIIVGTAMATWLYAHRRLEAIRYVRSHGGSIDFADGHDGSRVPDWLRGIQSIVDLPGGCDLRNCSALSDATNLILQHTQDDDLQSIGRFRQLTRLVLFDPQLTSRGMRYVRDCPRLKFVEIERPANGDELLEPLAGLPIAKLKLRDGKVTETGLRHLASFRALIELDLHGSKVSGANFKHLARLKLSKLNLCSTDVSDADLSQLSGISLSLLELEDTRITDAALPVLKTLGLSDLDLIHTLVTPAGTRALYGAKGLTVYLSRPPFDEPELEELRERGIQALPFQTE